MTDKELKHLNRSDLLEILIAQMEENEKLKKQLKEVEERANNRQIAINEAGSIAEAALRLNGVFDAAQAAAAQYLENVQRLSSERGAGHLQTDREMLKTVTPEENVPEEETSKAAILEQSEPEALSPEDEPMQEAAPAAPEALKQTDPAFVQAAADCEKLRADAEAYSEQMRTDAVAYSRQVRTGADAYSERVRADADAYSRRVRHEAEVYLRQMLEKAGTVLRSQQGGRAPSGSGGEGSQT